MTTQWRLLLSPPLPGDTNMALDEALLVSAGQGGQPTIRLYAWDGPWLSLGRLQQVDDMLDRERCVARGIGVVRRLTGGRAILHLPGEVTYSVSAAQAREEFGDGGIMAVYRAINAALVRGLASLGITASMRERPPLWPNTGVGFGCFEEAYRHEVYWAGRKIVASAQRRQGGGILQQGSIPGRETGSHLPDLLRLPPARRVSLKRDLSQRTGTLTRALDRVPSFGEVAAALADGFRHAWGITLADGTLTPEERSLAATLERETYSHSDLLREAGGVGR